MNIEQAKQKIEDLETAINHLIRNFQKDTGLEVERIDVRNIHHVGDGKVFRVDTIASVEIRIPKI